MAKVRLCMLVTKRDVAKIKRALRGIEGVKVSVEALPAEEAMRQEAALGEIGEILREAGVLNGDGVIVFFDKVKK